jgi:predicted  nucleic acid-binding Zn-ribbon protein
MSNIARQLFQLQDIDLETESDEHTLKLIVNQLGDSNKVIEAENKLGEDRLAYEELSRQQQSLEWDIEALDAKIKKIEGDLYGGSIRNPKELTDLQTESDSLKNSRAKLEEQALEIMEKVEKALRTAAASENGLKKLKDEWNSQQKKLAGDMEKLKAAIAGLNEKRERLTKDIDPATLEIYRELRKQRGTAVAKVQQGTCLGCRISLPVSELQRVRGGSLVRCSTCGRILFLA